MIATVRVIIKGSFRDSNDYFRNSSTWADIHLEANKAKREITRAEDDNEEDLEDDVFLKFGQDWNIGGR